MHALRLSALLAAVLLSISRPGHAQVTPGLNALFEQAWQRSVAGRSQSARAQEVEAIQARSRNWLANAPVLGHSQRSDRWSDAKGEKETETSLAATLYLPSQVNARRLHADRSRDVVVAQLASARLELAGELRKRFWDAAAAQALLDERGNHLKYTGELADEVTRRVAAGDLARSDSLLAQQELATARILAMQADSALRAAQAQLQLLTASTALPAAVPEALADRVPAPHPRLSVSAAAEQQADAALQLTQAERLPNPTLSLALRREQEARFAMPERSVGIAVHIPLGSAGRNRVAEAQALAQKAATGTEHALLAQEISAMQALSRARLANARTALAAAEQRDAAMREYSQLIQKAFRLGERGLAERLRAQTLAHEAAIALRQQQIDVGRAHAEYNQASGVLP
jgi:outer membrane protein TolC